jgi:hypothetical protein
MKRCVRGFGCPSETELCQVDERPDDLVRVLEQKTTGTGRGRVARYSSVRVVANGEDAS